MPIEINYALVVVKVNYYFLNLEESVTQPGLPRLGLGSNLADCHYNP
jgi:hypothetical protein